MTEARRPQQDPPDEDEQSAQLPGRHRMVVDRREGDLIVVETAEGQLLDLPEWLLPAGTREGNVVVVESWTAEDGSRRLELRVDRDATAAARGEAGRMLERLRSRDPGGDIEL